MEYDSSEAFSSANVISGQINAYPPPNDPFYLNAFVSGPLQVLLSSVMRHFKPLGIALKVDASGEICEVFIFLLILFFPDFYAIYEICQRFHNGQGVKTVVS